MTSYGFLSTYPPTRCGLATFTQSLAAELRKLGAQISVVRSLDALTDVGAPSPSEVVADLLPGDELSLATSVQALDECDVVIVQHEYGIYGGVDGDEVLEVLSGLTAPAIVVAHTVLEHPTTRQREILERCARLSASFVVMSRHAYDLLANRYDVPMERVAIIPHGVHVIRADRIGRTRPRILTWGLLGPGKGIEWGIAALAAFEDDASRPEYVVAGATHPKVRAELGESYRLSLQALAGQLGLLRDVRFIDAFLDPEALSRLIASADVVLLPYDSLEQVTSGVLVDALAAGRPVVATDFPHAVELLGDGAGIVVPHRDPAAIADALHAIIDDPQRARGMADAADRLTAGSGWDDVARTYERLVERVLSFRAA